MRALIAEYDLETSHFLGQAWSRDATGLHRERRVPLEEVLVKGRPYQSSSLKSRLLQEGVKKKQCEGCGETRWLGHDIPLELDHINGDPDDNRLVNLRLLCPNCHALTDNYRGRNIGRR